MKTARIEISNGDMVGTLQDLLAKLLESGAVEAVLVPRMLPGGGGFVQGLIRDPLLMKETHPIAPTMAVQSARIMSELTSKPLESRIAAVLKPCELRAATELTKFLQVNLDNVITVAVDCEGTFDVREYAENTSKTTRESCRICEEAVATNADLSIGLYGTDTSKEVFLFIGPRFENEILEALALDTSEGIPEQRTKAVEQTRVKRDEERRTVLASIAERISSPAKLMETFSTCIRCHNCMQACPICYCKECVFMSDVFARRPEQLMGWADRQGGIRMPADTLMFHLTRMSHMATSCVGCGMCESACPSRLPVSSLFTLVGDDLQEMFEYSPGRDAAEEPPVSVFKEDELQTESPHGA